MEGQKKKEKKEKSVEQLTMEAVEVSLGENHDHDAVSLKRKKLTARSYKALFTKQRKSISEPGRPTSPIKLFSQYNDFADNLDIFLHSFFPNYSSLV